MNNVSTTDCVIIGAGHAGLAVSQCLNARGIEHVVLERGEIANAWRTQRWDSLRLLTPNWQAQLPDFSYNGNDPDGYMSMPEVTHFIEQYARHISAPVYTNTNVLAVSRTPLGYHIRTDRGDWRCRTLVIASGICNKPAIPAMAEKFPDTINTISPLEYKNPNDLSPGNVLVVGASATGLQLAEEIQQSGREVTLAVGEHVRMPRTYRGRDIQWWMDVTGLLDDTIDQQDDIARAQRLPSPQLIGTPQRRTLDLNTIQSQGIHVVGRLAAVRDNTVLFSGSLRNCCALADLKMNRMLKAFDEWALNADQECDLTESEHHAPTRVPDPPQLSLNIEKQNIRTIVWATGFRPDYSWLHLPVLNGKGKLIQHNGVVGNQQSNTPGLYAMGLSFMRHRKSSFIYGASDDANAIANEIDTYLNTFAKQNHNPLTVLQNTIVTDPALRKAI